MNYKILVYQVLTLGFLFLCLVLFNLPVIKETPYFEEANGYDVLFGAVTRHDYGVGPNNIIDVEVTKGFQGLASMFSYILALITIIISICLYVNGREEFATFYIITLFAIIIFASSYLFINETIPDAKSVFQSDDWFTTYHYHETERANGATIVGSIGLILVGVQMIDFYITYKIIKKEH